MSISQVDPQLDGLFSTLQGNILKGHGRDHTANVFLTFAADRREDARAWLHEFAASTVTSTKVQLEQTDSFKRHAIPGGLFAGVYLTWAAYDYFAIAPERRPALTGSAFAGGMRGADLHDDFADWDPRFRDDTIHVMVLLGHDDKTVLSKTVAALIVRVRPLTLAAALGATADARFASPGISIEYGNAIRNANGDGLEHFGYVDGISQPLFFTDELTKASTDAVPMLGADGAAAWDAAADTALVLAPDHADAPHQGSFYVFRKLEQDVRRFKLAERQLAHAMELDDDALELAGAMLVGRFEDGTPVTLSDDDGMIGAGAANNFNYAADAGGLKCPFHAHIRKTNPRGSGGAPGNPPGSPDAILAFEKTHIMARRGIPYGLREVTTTFDCEPEQFPTGAGVGLLFQSFQADIANQFEFIQNSWANAANFPFANPDGNSGVDPLIGQASTAAGRDFHWPIEHLPGKSDHVDHTFASFIKVRGGEYFFAPSLPALAEL